MGKKQNPLCARVKRMMQADVEVNRRQCAGQLSENFRAELVRSYYAGKALEIFLKELCEGAGEVAVQRKEYVMQAQRMDFLKGKFAEVPDLPEHVPRAAQPPKPKPPKPKKRQRADEPAAETPAAKAGKGNKDFIHQEPESTPFTAPPVAAARQSPNICADHCSGKQEPDTAAPVPEAGECLEMMDSSKPVQTAGLMGVAVGAAPAAFPVPNCNAGIQPQAVQPVAAEEDDYDAD